MVPQNNDLAAKLKAAKERLEAKNRKDTQSVALSANPANPLSKYYQPEQAATTPKPTQTEQVKSIPGPFVSQPSFQPSASPTNPPAQKPKGSPTPLVTPNQPSYGTAITPGTVGKSGVDFKFPLLKTGQPSDPAYRFQGKDVSREQVSQIISQAPDQSYLDRLQIANDPELMEAVKLKLQQLKNQPKSEPNTKKTDPSDNSFGKNFMDGMAIGWEDLKGSTVKGISEFMDLAATTPLGISGAASLPNTPKLGQDYQQLKKDQAAGKTGAITPTLNQYAKNQQLKGERMIEERNADPESWGFMAGSLIPQGAGIAAAVGVGAINPALGMGLGVANTAALTSMSYGAAAQEYDQYVAEKGIEYDPNARLGTMILTAAAEMGSEAIPVAKFIPKGFRGKMGKFIFGDTEVTSKMGRELLEEFANTNASRKQLVKNLLRESAEGALTEGPTEAFAELAGEFSTWLYKEKEDRASWQEMIKNGLTATAAGGLMGSAIGPLSYGAQQVQNQRRRKDSGKVILAQDKNTGEAVEIMGMANADKDGAPPKDAAIQYQAIRPNGKIYEVDENQLDGILEIPEPMFNGLLKGKAKAEADSESQINQQVAQEAQAEQNSIRDQYQPMVFNGMDGTPMISGAKFNGEDVFVTALLPDGSAVIQKPGEEKTVVPQSGLTDQETLPFEQFMQQFAPAPDPVAPVFDPTNPIQKGEEVNIQGTSYVVTGFDPESGTVQLENTEDGSDLPALTVYQFNQIRQPQQPATNQNTQSNQTAEELRKIFGQQDEVPEGSETFETGSEVDLGSPQSKPKQSGLVDVPRNEANAIAKEFAQKMGIQGQVPTASSFDGGTDLSEIQNWMRNQGPEGDQLADILEFPEAAKRLLAKMQAREQAPTPNPNEPLPAQPAGNTQQLSRPEQTGVGQPASETLPAQPGDQGADNQVPLTTIPNQPTTTPNEVQQPQPSGQNGQEDVQNPQNQEDRSQEGEGQEELVQGQISEEEKALQLSQGNLQTRKRETEANPEDVDRINRETEYEDIRNASTRDELIDLYQAEAQNKEAIPPKDQFIADTLGTQKVDPDSFAQNNDQNNISQGIAKAWFGKKGQGAKLDLIAMEASEAMTPGNTESITPEDVANFLLTYPSMESLSQPSRNPKLKAIQDKAIAVSGKGINIKSKVKPKNKSVNLSENGQLLETDAQIAEYLENNPDILSFLQGEFGEKSSDLLTNSGEINWKKALEILDSDPDYFTLFPGGFEKSELDSIRKVINSNINEADSSTNPTVQADSNTQKPSGNEADRPNQTAKTDRTGTEPTTGRTGQEPNPTNPDRTGESKSGRGEGTGSDSAYGNLNPKGNFLSDLNAARESGVSEKDITAIEQKGKTLNAIRKDFPQLTDAHENEIYSELNSSTKPDEVAKSVFSKVNDVAFDPKKPLNFSNQKESKAETKKNEIQSKIDGIKKRVKQLKVLPQTKAIKEEAQTLTKELNQLLGQLDNAMSNQEATKPAQQEDLFAQPKEEAKKPTSAKELNEALSVRERIKQNSEKWAEDQEKKKAQSRKKPEIKKPIEDGRPDFSNDISLETAKNAYRGISFDPDKRGVGQINDYINTMNWVWDELFPLAVSEDQKTVFESEFDRIRKGIIQRTNNYLSAKSRTISPMITGPARFPVARNEKAMRTENKRSEELIDYRKKAVETAKKRLKEAATPEQKQAIQNEAIQKQIDVVKEDIQFLVDGLAEAKNGGKPFPYSPQLLKSAIKRKIANITLPISPEAGQKVVDWANDYAKEKKVKPLFTSKNSVFKYIETAKIQKEKAENETNQPQKESEVLFENDQVKISRDPSIDRILVQNPDVPSKAIRDKLKAAAWRWSPTNKAWQRKDTREAVESAKRIFGITELNPDQERMLIIGEKGASRLDQIEEATTRLDNLAVARQMEAEGIQPVFQAYREAMAEVDRLNEAKDFDTDRDYLEAPIERMYAALGYNQYSADREVRGISWVPLNPTQIKSATGNQGTFDPKNPDIRFSRPSTISELNQRIGESRAQELIQAPQGPKPTKKAADIAKKAADFTSTWQNAPQIRTFNSAQEALDSYPELQSRYSIEDMENVPALFIKNPDTGATEAVLIASHSYLSEKGGVEKALLHEVIGHYGIREFLKQQAQGDRKKYVQEYNTLMQQVFDAKKSDRTLADIAKRYFGKEVSQLTANEQIIVGDEYLAHVAQDGVQDKWIDRVVAKLRQILRQLGIKIGLSDAEIRNLIGNSMRIVRGPQGRPVVRENVDQTNGPRFMVEDSTLDQTQSPAFKAWFRDSKVVDENGKPLVVYHATQSDFDSFDKKKAGSAIDFGTLGEGFYFTSDPENASNYARNLSSNTGISGGENIIPAFLSIKNPYKAKNLREVSGDNKSESRKFREKLIAKGYDGIEFDNPFGPFSWYVAFEPTQIKSATGNNGDFNPDNADIRFMKVGASNADFSAVNSKNLQDAKLSWWERKVIEPLQDRMIRGKKLIKAKAGDQVSDKADFYTRENLKSGKTLEKARRFEKDLWNPMIQTANQIKNATGLEPSDISDYLKFKHHGERKQYFIDEYKKEGKAIPKDEKWPTGMTDQEAADGIKAFESKVDKRLVDKLNKQVKAVSRFTTVERFKAGMITKEVYRDLLTRYKNYVPLTDWKGMEATNDQVYTLLMSAKGRTSEAADPLPFLFTAAQEAIMRGENNRVRQSVLEFVKENVSPGDYFIRKAYYVNTRSQDEFGNDIWIETMNKPTDAQLANGEAMSSFNPQVHRHVQQQGETTNVLPVMVEGKKVFIEFKDPEIPSTIKNINQDKVPGYLTWMRKYTRWLSSMYTQYSPEFGVRNLIRDVGFGVYNMMVDQDATTARKTIGKMAKSTGTLGYFFRTGEYRKGKDGNYLKEFMEEGAMTGYTDLETAADVFRRAQKEISKADQTNLWQKGGKALAKPILAFGEGIEIYNKTLENAMRFSYYKTLRDQGMSKQKAAIRAKDLTVNFNRKGKSSSALGAVYIFFNAAVQGNERLIRSFTNPKTRRKASGYAGAVIAAGMMQSLLFGLFDEEDEDGKTFYEKIPDYVRRNNLILRNPFSENPNDFVKIPLPYGLNIFHSFGESLGQVLTGRKSVGQEAIGMLSAASNVFSPLGGFEFSSEQDGFEQVAQVAFPSAGQPLLDLAFNRNFTGRAIYREPSQYANYSPPDSQMYFEGVNPYIKEATTFLNQLTGGNEVKSGAIDINPEWIEYGMEQYFGGPVQFGKNMSTTITELINGENVLEDPNIRRVPFVRSFVSKTGTDFEARQNFYENRNNAEAAMEEYKAYLKKGMDQEAAEFFQENQNLMMLADIHKKYDKHISEMTRTINQLKKADPEQYDDQIEQLYEQRTQLMREFNKQYGEIMFKNRPNPIKQILNLD